MFSFIIATCVRNDLHLNQLIRCINSVRKFHPENKIILINDSEDNYNINELFENDKNIFIEKTLNKGSADQQVFKLLLEKDDNNKAFIMQDSMLLNKPLENVEKVKDVKFLWHFTNHRKHWDIIPEPTTEYNNKNNIITHTDLIRHYLIKDYSNYPDFLNYALYALNNKNIWCGALGNGCIIDKETVRIMNNRIHFVDIFVNYITNRERRVNESIFPLICHYLFPTIDFQDSYDGLYYDGYQTPRYNGIETGFDNLTWFSSKEYISKVSFDR